MAEVLDVDVTPSARVRLFYCDPVPISAFAKVAEFGGWGKSPMDEPPLLREPAEVEIAAACSRACGRQLYLWGWELRSCGTLAFHFRVSPPPPQGQPTWAESVEAGAQVEAEPVQRDLFGEGGGEDDRGRMAGV